MVRNSRARNGNKRCAFRDEMDVEYLLNHLRQNETNSEILSDEQFIERVTRNNQEKEVKDYSSVFEVRLTQKKPLKRQ